MRFARKIALLIIGAVIGYTVAWLRTTESNPGHGITNFYLALDTAEDASLPDQRVERLLSIDVRYIPPQIRRAFYEYVAAALEEADARRSHGLSAALEERTKAARRALQELVSE